MKTERPQGGRDRDRDDLVVLARTLLGESRPKACDDGANGGEVGIRRQRKAVGLDGPHAIKRGIVVHRGEPYRDA